jgi:hypothetical protein
MFLLLVENLKDFTERFHLTNVTDKITVFSSEDNGTVERANQEVLRH